MGGVSRRRIRSSPTRNDCNETTTGLVGPDSGRMFADSPKIDGEQAVLARAITFYSRYRRPQYRLAGCPGLSGQRVNDHWSGHRRRRTSEQGREALFDPGEPESVGLLGTRVIVEDADAVTVSSGAIDHVVGSEAWTSLCNKKCGDSEDIEYGKCVRRVRRNQESILLLARECIVEWGQ